MQLYNAAITAKHKHAYLTLRIISTEYILELFMKPRSRKINIPRSLYFIDNYLCAHYDFADRLPYYKSMLRDIVREMIKFNGSRSEVTEFILN